MSLYYRIADPSDVRDLGDQMAAWIASGNPKAAAWAEQPDRPSDTAQWVDGEWVEPPPAPPADAEMWQVRVWLARNGVNPAGIPAIIKSMTEDGPERWEALERWHTVTRVPITHSMVPLLWAVVAPGLERELTLEQAWEEILAT